MHLVSLRHTLNLINCNFSISSKSYESKGKLYLQSSIHFFTISKLDLDIPSTFHLHHSAQQLFGNVCTSYPQQVGNNSVLEPESVYTIMTHYILKTKPSCQKTTKNCSCIVYEMTPVGVFRNIQGAAYENAA